MENDDAFTLCAVGFLNAMIDPSNIFELECSPRPDRARVRTEVYSEDRLFLVILNALRLQVGDEGVIQVPPRPFGLDFVTQRERRAA